MSASTSVDGAAELVAVELAVRVLAVGSVVVMSIYLRERDLPKSKPVVAPHSTPR